MNTGENAGRNEVVTAPAGLTWTGSVVYFGAVGMGRKLLAQQAPAGLLRSWQLRGPGASRASC